MVIHVASISDPRLADYRNIPDPDLLRERGIFVAEGRHVVRRLVAESRFLTRSLLVTPPAYESLADLHSRLAALPVFIVDQNAMTEIAGFNIHRGCLAIGEREALPPWSDLARDARRLVILEHVSNADNVGGIFRNAAAFGVDAVLLGPACTDPLYRKAIRTSMGAALKIPFASLDGWPGDLEALRQAGFTLIALTPAPDAEDLRTSAAQRRGAAERIALLLGHEGHGLSDAAMQCADVRFRIAMAAGVDSLNVAAAAAVALYELSR